MKIKSLTDNMKNNILSKELSAGSFPAPLSISIMYQAKDPHEEGHKPSTREPEPSPESFHDENGEQSTYPPKTLYDWGIADARVIVSPDPYDFNSPDIHIEGINADRLLLSQRTVISNILHDALNQFSSRTIDHQNRFFVSHYVKSRLLSWAEREMSPGKFSGE